MREFSVRDPAHENNHDGCGNVLRALASVPQCVPRVFLTSPCVNPRAFYSSASNPDGEECFGSDVMSRECCSQSVNNATHVAAVFRSPLRRIPPAECPSLPAPFPSVY